MQKRGFEVSWRICNFGIISGIQNAAVLYGADAVKYLPSLAIVALVVAVQYPVRKLIARRRKSGN